MQKTKKGNWLLKGLNLYFFDNWRSRHMLPLHQEALFSFVDKKRLFGCVSYVAARNRRMIFGTCLNVIAELRLCIRDVCQSDCSITSRYIKRATKKFHNHVKPLTKKVQGAKNTIGFWRSWTLVHDARKHGDHDVTATPRSHFLFCEYKMAYLDLYYHKTPGPRVTFDALPCGVTPKAELRAITLHPTCTNAALLPSKIIGKVYASMTRTISANRNQGWVCDLLCIVPANNDAELVKRYTILLK